MVTNFLELATTLKYLGAKWLSGEKLILRPGFILFGALVAPVYFQLEPLLLWFYFIWGPCCSCLF